MGTVAPAASVVDAIDVDGITEALDGAKEAIVEAIRAELHRQAPRPGLRPRFHLAVTDAMLTPVVALYERGRREAAAELERAGVTLPRQYATTVPRRLDDVYLRLTVGLNAIGRRAETDLARLTETGSDDVNALVRGRISNAIDRVPGLRAVAASLVSESFIAGTADLYEENADAFGGFVATSVLDGSTCSRCSSVDGTTYPTNQAAAAAGWGNGGWGPYAECFGGPRCRCRIVPIPGARRDEVVAGALPGEPVPDVSALLLTVEALRAAGAAPVAVARGVFAYLGVRYRIERGPRGWRAIDEATRLPLTEWQASRRRAERAAVSAIEGRR